MIQKTFACFKAFLYGWMGILILQAAERAFASSPLEISSLSMQGLNAAHETPYLDLLKKNPFLPGSVHAGKKLAADKKGDEQEWILRGTLMADSGGKAVIEEKGTGIQRWVGVGEVIQDYRVVAIEREGVRLKGAQGEVRLALYRDAAERPADVEPLAVAAAAPVSGDVRQLGQNEFLIKQSFVRKLSEEIPEFLNSLGLILFEGEKGPAGYLIAEDPGKPNLRPMGIRDGDLIEKINGRPLRSDQDLMEAFSDFSKEREFKVEVARDDEIKVFTYHVEQQ